MEIVLVSYELFLLYVYPIICIFVHKHLKFLSKTLFPFSFISFGTFIIHEQYIV